MHIPIIFLQGLDFLDELHDVWSKHQFNPQRFDLECKQLVLLLLQLVDVTGNHPNIYLKKFLLDRSIVIKKYHRDIVKHVSTKPYRFWILNKSHEHTHTCHLLFR